MYIYPGEKTASIRIYAETQSFYDFGRCTGGDVIRLWSHVRDVDSWTALYESTRSRQLVEELYSDCDSVQAFIRDRLAKDFSEKIKTKELSEMYKSYCQEVEREPLSRNNFYRNLREKGYGKKTIDGYDYIVGLKTKENTSFVKVDQNEIPFD